MPEEKASHVIRLVTRQVAFPSPADGDTIDKFVADANRAPNHHKFWTEHQERLSRLGWERSGWDY